MTQKEFLALIALAVLFGFIVFCLYYIFADEPEPVPEPRTPKPKAGEPQRENPPEKESRSLEPPQKKKKPPKRTRARRLPRKGESREIVIDQKTRDGQGAGLGI